MPKPNIPNEEFKDLLKNLLMSRNPLEMKFKNIDLFFDKYSIYINHNYITVGESPIDNATNEKSSGIIK